MAGLDARRHRKDTLLKRELIDDDSSVMTAVLLAIAFVFAGISRVVADTPNESMRTGRFADMANMGAPMRIARVAHAQDHIDVRLRNGLPRQTPGMWRRELAGALAWEPRQVEVAPPMVDRGSRMWEEAARGDDINGEVWALPGHASRLAQAAGWGVETLGLGVGAVSRVDGFAYENTDELDLYLARSADVAIVRDVRCVGKANEIRRMHRIAVSSWSVPFHALQEKSSVILLLRHVKRNTARTAHRPSALHV